MSIRNVLALVVGGLLVAAQLAVIWYVTSSSYKALMDVQLNHMKTVTDTVDKAFDDLIENNLTVVKVFSSVQALKDLLQRPTDPDAMDQAAARLAHFMGGDADFESATIFDTKGQVILAVGRNGTRLATPSLADRDFVQAALSGREGVSGTPVVSRITGKTVMLFSTPIVDANGKVLGGFCFSHNYEGILKEFISEVKVGERGYPFVMTDKGLIIAHPRRDLLFKDTSGEELTKRILSAPEGTMSYVLDGKAKILNWRLNPERKWVFISSAEESDLAAVAVEQRDRLLFAGAAITLLGLGVVFWALHKLVVKPVRAFETFATKVATGDMGAQLASYRTVELNSLAANLEAMLAQLKDRLGFAQGVVDGLSAPFYITDAKGLVSHVSDELLRLSGRQRERAVGRAPEELFGAAADLAYAEVLRSGRAVHERTVNLVRAQGTLTLREDASPISDLDGRLIGAICLYTDLTEIMRREEQLAAAHESQLDQAAQADVVAARVSSLTQELAAQVEQVRALAMGQGERVAESRTAMEQISVSIVEVAKNASDTALMGQTARARAEAGAESVRHVVDAVDEVKKCAEGLRRDMQGLGTSAASIGGIMTVISDIADQTNLLALNAAIEAARAGEAGRGFAVVADEVRKLAEKTMAATKEVGQVVSGIQDGAAKGISGVDMAAEGARQAADLAQTAGAALSEIVSLVTESATQVEAIAAATEQQSAATGQIASGVDEMGRAGQETVSATIESVNALGGLAEQTLLLERLTSEMRQGDPVRTRGLAA